MSLTRRLGYRLGAWRWTAPVLVGAAMLLALTHARAIAPYYHVGSFDDDASYITGARAIAAGGGLSTVLDAGYPLVSAYPPGYSALLAPLVLLGGQVTVHMRVLSLLFYLSLFPLTWWYLSRRGWGLARVAVLVLLALNPVLATYSTMIMAETAFVVMLMVLLALVERWERQPRVLTWTGGLTVLACGGLIWLKEASIGMVIGLVLWFVISRAWAKAGLVAAGSAVLFSPVVISRIALGVSVVGSRYSTDYVGAYTGGGLVSRVVHLVPSAVGLYLSDAVTNSIVPVHVSPLPAHGLIDTILGITQWSTAPLVLIGVVVWWKRRYGRAVVVMLAVYLSETLVYPYINERRLVLFAPILLAWYVLGAQRSAQFVLAGLRRVGSQSDRPAQAAMAVVVVCLVIIPLVHQLPRYYLLDYRQETSNPTGSPYMALLAALGTNSEVVETDYIWSTSLNSGHRTANTAYLDACTDDPRPAPLGGLLADDLSKDRAGLVLFAALNRPSVISSWCLARLAQSDAHFVRLARFLQDNATVYELIGPGTANPDLIDLTAGELPVSSTPASTYGSESPIVPGATSTSYPIARTGTDGSVSLTWSWGSARHVTQVSLGAAGSQAGATTLVELQLRVAGGAWRTVAQAPLGVGGSSVLAPWLIAHPDGQAANAARVVIHGQGSVAVHDFQVLANQ